MTRKESTSPAPDDPRPTQPEVPGASRPTPSPAAHSEELSIAFAGNPGSAEAAAKWLADIMPRGESEGLNLPSLRMADPTKPDYPEIFGPGREASRRLLAQRVKGWLSVLESAADLDQAKESVDARVSRASALLEKNLSRAFEKIRPVEQTYRTLDAFFANAEGRPGEAVDAWILNLNASLLHDRHKPHFELLESEIRKHYRAFNQGHNFGLLVVPGWAGSVASIERLARLGYQNKVHVVTDGPDAESAQTLVDKLADKSLEGLLGFEKFKRNLSLYGNYVKLRERHGFEKDALFVPPSLLVAGAMYRTDDEEGKGPQVPIFGYTNGQLKAAVGVRFQLDKDQTGLLVEKHGLNPVLRYEGLKFVVMGDQTLSKEEGYRSYAPIRTVDWILKNVTHYLNYKTGELINYDNMQKWRIAISTFLQAISRRDGTRMILDGTVKVVATPAEIAKSMVKVMLTIESQIPVRHFEVSATRGASRLEDVDIQEKK